MRTENQLEALRMIVGYIQQYAVYEPYENNLLPSRVLHDAVINAGNDYLSLTQLQAIDVVVSALVETDLFSEGFSILPDGKRLLSFDRRTIFQALYLLSAASELTPRFANACKYSGDILRVVKIGTAPPELIRPDGETGLRFAYEIDGAKQLAPIKGVSILEEIQSTVEGDIEIIRTFRLFSNEIYFEKQLEFQLNHPDRF